MEALLPAQKIFAVCVPITAALDLVVFTSVVSVQEEPFQDSTLANCGGPIAPETCSAAV